MIDDYPMVFPSLPISSHRYPHSILPFHHVFWATMEYLSYDVVFMIRVPKITNNIHIFL